MPPILIPSSAKFTPTQILVITKLNGRKENKVQKLFKIENEVTRMTSMAKFWCLILDY